MLTGKTGFLFSVALITATVMISEGCNHGVYKVEIPDSPNSSDEIKEEGIPVSNSEIAGASDLITQLYEKSNTLLSDAWNSRENLYQMLFVLHNIYREGLNPEDYNLSAIEKLTDKIILSDPAEAEDVIKLDMLLTDAFLLLSTHLARGKTDAATIDPHWKASGMALTTDLGRFTDSTLLNDCIIENLRTLTPTHREYSNLKKALAEYRRIKEKGGWKRINTIHPKLEIGMCDPDVALLRDRLAITQVYIENDTVNKDMFDLSLLHQVKLFQLRNGLTQDGVVGRGTIEAMNIPVEERIATIEANLERWRWLGSDPGERYIRVNIANFDLKIIERDDMVFSTETIVGLTDRKTPVFSSIMKYLVLNPDWTVPPTILKQDVIPSVILNPEYLAEKNLKIIRNDGTEVDPLSIDWTNVTTTDFPYRVYQEPGPGNALGRVKFIFPNQYSVYIHDTPNRNLFGRTDRSFSSGCIRVNNPMELVAWLLKDKPGWTPGQIKNIVDQGKEQVVYLETPMQVHILYLTAWAGDDGSVQFSKDIYNLDQPLMAALRQGSRKEVQ